MGLRSWLIVILTIAIAFGMAYLGDVEVSKGARNAESPSWSLRALIFVADNKPLILGLMAALSAATSLLGEVIWPRQYAKEVRRQLMRNLLSRVAGNNPVDYRVTLFLERGRLLSFLLFLKDYFGWRSSNYRNTRVCHQPRYGRYVQIADRVGSQHPASKTCFPGATASVDDAEGAAGRAWQTKSAQDVEDLPDIRNVDLSSLDLLGDSPTAKGVRQYMERGFIRRVETLGRLKVRARHFYADVLTSKSGEYVGVLVIDSVSPQSFLTDETRLWIASYCASIGYTFH
jgi:hypothetical protein